MKPFVLRPVEDSSMRTRTNGKKILFVVPRVVLADQQLEVIKTQLKGLPEELTRVSIQITKSYAVVKNNKGDR